ncbi:MAG: TonB-dependent receptor [Marinilabiliaceae bacterium]|nr:TonB-dependent receptor [Marinilabiliaceae bacterium]
MQLNVINRTYHYYLKKSLCLFVLVAISLTGWAQQGKISGRLLDGDSGEPIPYANALITSPADSAVFMGAITDNAGHFMIADIPQGTGYLVKLSFVGYQSVTLNDVLVQRGERDLGEIRLSVLTENMDEVTVRAARSAISYKVDRKVIDAGSFPGANVAMDLLDNVPGLQVDFEGKLTYRGDGTFKVYINGHPVANGEEKLKEIPAERIDRVEVITNPSAKYDSEGTAGIIQVILKKNRLQGYAISASAKVDTREGYDWLFGVDQKGEKGGWYVKGKLQKYQWTWSTNDMMRQTQEGQNRYVTLIHEDKKGFSFNNWLDLGFNYDLTEKDYIDLAINVEPLKRTNEEAAEGTIREQLFQNTQIDQDEVYNLNSDSYLSYRYLGIDFTYEHAFNKKRDHLLSAYISYSGYLHPLKEWQKDTKSTPVVTERTGHKGSEENEVFWSANINYARPLGENSSFEMGVEINTDEIPKLSTTSGWFDKDDNIIPFSTDRLNQEVVFHENIYAGYVTYKGQVNKLEYQLGARVEHTDRQSDYSYTNENGERVEEPARKNFTDFFPTIHAVYNFSEANQLSASYSKRINRPDYWTLIPMNQYSSPYSFYQGNGNVLPSYSHALELGYKRSWDKDFIAFETFARRTLNLRQNYTRQLSERITRYTPENVGASWSIGAEVMAGVDVYAWWNMNLSTSFYSYHLHTEIEDIDKKEQQYRFDSRLNQTFLLPASMTLKWDVSYKSPIISAQERREDYFFTNVAVRKGFMKDQWKVTVTAHNLLNTLKYDHTAEGTGFLIETHTTEKPYFSLKVVYRFDNQK